MFEHCADPKSLEGLTWLGCYLTTPKHMSFWASFLTVLGLLAAAVPPIMILGLAGALAQDPDETAEQLKPQLAALEMVFESLSDHRSQIALAQDALRKRNFYAAMRAIHPLIAVERELLARSNCIANSAAMHSGMEPPAA